MHMLKPIAVALALIGLPAAAYAQQVDDVGTLSSSLTSAGSGQMSPLLLGATLGSERALVMGGAGYDTSRSGALFDSAAEVRIWGPIALRAGVTYSDDTRRMRPSVGARVQLLRQAAHGIDGSLSSFFKTEGFNEMEGEIETAVAIGRRFDRLYLLGNLAYGQDPEGRERDGELRASLLRSQGWGVWGLEVRGRSAIGAQHAPTSAQEPRLDAVGGPIAMVALGNIVVFAEAGPSVVRPAGADLRWGIASLAGFGSAF
jgi:hypothetical protein